VINPHHPAINDRALVIKPRPMVINDRHPAINDRALVIIDRHPAITPCNVVVEARWEYAQASTTVAPITALRLHTAVIETPIRLFLLRI